MALREKGEPSLRGAGDPLAQELSRTDRDLGLDHVVGAAQRISERIQKDEQSLALVVPQNEPGQRRPREPGQPEPTELPEPHAGPEEEREEDREQDERRAQVGLPDPPDQ